MKWGCLRNGGARPAQFKGLVWGAAVVEEMVIGGVVMGTAGVDRRGYTRHVSWRYVVIYTSTSSVVAMLCPCQWPQNGHHAANQGSSRLDA